MQTFKWLYTKPVSWGFVGRVLLKAALLFVALNLIFAWIKPLPTLGRISGYNVLYDGRERLPYGENAAASYNLSLYQIDAMFASHTVDDLDSGDFNIFIVGDSSVWGFLLENDDTLAGQINRAGYHTADGQPVHAYNLGYPGMSLTQDLLLLDYALEHYRPDMVIWLVTLKSFDRAQQLSPAFLKNNRDSVRDLIDRYALVQDQNDPRLVETNFWDETIIGRRRDLADLLRLQYNGIMWDATGIDQEYPTDYTPRAVNFDPDPAWEGYWPEQFGQSMTLADVLSFEVLPAGAYRVGSTPFLLVNEPIFISDGTNSDLRYNAFYPRWAYDEYRALLSKLVNFHRWHYLDAWDALPDVACYTDSPVHLTPTCSQQLSVLVMQKTAQILDNGIITDN